MAEVVLRHEIFCTEEDYWNKCVWTREFNEGLYVKTLGFPRYEVQGETDGADVRTRRTFIEPPVGALPGPLKKAIGDKLSEVKVFGIGGLVEDRIMDDLRRSYDAGEKFTNDFATAGGYSTR